jgi:hypothetical protein
MRRQLLAAVLAALVLAPAGAAWTWPATGAVLEPFLFDPAHPYAAGQHRGIAIAGDPAASVLAPAAGTVTYAGTVPSSGKSVTITTPDGYAVTLTHLGSIVVARGALVAEGDGVGTIAETGDAEIPQPYVHVGVRIAAQPQGYLDPLTFLPARVPAPTALVPPVVVDLPAPPPAAEPAPAPVAAPVPDPAPSAGPALVEPPTAAPVTPEPTSAPPVEAPGPAAPLPVEPAPASAPEPGAPAVARGEVAAPATPVVEPASEGPGAHGGARIAASDVATAATAVNDDPPRHGSWAKPSSLAHRSAALRSVEALGRAVADARGRGHARRVHRRPVARVPGAPTVRSVGLATRAAAHRSTDHPAALAVAAVLAAAALTGALGAVRMMVRRGTRTEEEDLGRTGLAVCGGAPAPWARGGLRRTVGRIRPLSPAEGQRRPHGEWHGRARHAGDGGRRQGGQVLR